MALIVGLNSGSSCDGVDCVLADISTAEDGQPTPPRFIDGISVKWPERVHKMIWQAFENKLDVIELSKLNYAIGACFGVTVKKLLDKCNLKSEDIEVIGVDGQQIFLHQPDREKADNLTPEQKEEYVSLFLDDIYAYGVCFGEGSVVAAYTDITTVAQFRPADHALSGQGAPLMQYLDYVLFRESGPILTLNIGGISNVHKVYKDRKKMLAFDCGPGNIMIDYIAKKYFNKEFDPNGEIAARGKVDEGLLNELMSAPFLKRPIPRSAWRNDFDTEYSEKMRRKYIHLTDEDIMATYNAFTAACIANSIKDFTNPSDTKELVASGGGVFNKTLMSNIQKRLPEHMTLVTSDKYGIPPQFKEALKFATLGYAAIHNIANNIPHASHAEKYSILGHICPPPRYAKAIR